MNSKAIYLVGVDDTDYGDSIGTGAFARELMVHLQTHLGVHPMGITRHQLLVHPDIPYTSHNSAACLQIGGVESGDECNDVLNAVIETCRRFVQFLFHPGADPGLCIVAPAHITESIIAFGQRAQKEVVTKKEALELGSGNGVLLEEHGGEGIGVIGALAACALRHSGNDGRFISHVNIREVGETLTVAELKSQTAVERVVDEQMIPLADELTVNTNNWLRPDLFQGQVTLRVRPFDGNADYYVFKKKKGTDDM